MKRSTANFLFVGLIIAVIIFMIWMVGWLKSESKDCTINPVKYFHEKNPDITCSCYGKNGRIIESLMRDEEIIFNIQP